MSCTWISRKTRMSWQKCPVCNGSGTAFNPHTMNTVDACPTCNGQRIIHDITGKPPVVPGTTIPMCLCGTSLKSSCPQHPVQKVTIT